MSRAPAVRTRRSKSPSPKARGSLAPDRHVLYEAAVQCVSFDLGFFARTYRRLRGESFTWLREDFCGTAALACDWARRSPGHRAWGVDLDAPTLRWAGTHRLPTIGKAVERVTLLHGDVRTTRTPRVDVIAALNCSYWVFKERADLVAYFRAARRGLRPGGLLILDLFGGEGVTNTAVERRWIRGMRDHRGVRVPPFRYIWEQKRFNPVDHHIVCQIHFESLPGERAMRRAFTYDWRMWTAPELRDALRDAGFRDTHVYVQGWDDERGMPLDVYRRRVRFENQEGWLAYIVAER